MHHFLIVKAKSKSAKQTLFDRLIKGLDHLVPYEPHRRKILSLADDVYFASTESHDFLGLGEKSGQFGERFIAYEGFCFLKSRGENTLDLFRDIFQKRSIFEANDYLDGEFCAVNYEENGDTINVISDFTGLRPIYYLNNEDYFAASNRQMFLNPLLTRSGRLETDWQQCYDQLAYRLNRLAGWHDAKGPCHDTVKDMVAGLESQDSGEIFRQGLHETVQHGLMVTNRLGAEIAQTYHFG
mgnify:CR=1 FL=1